MTTKLTIVAEEGTLRWYMQVYHQWMREMNYSGHTIRNHRCFFGKFVRWCEDRSITAPKDVSQALIERYQKGLHQGLGPEEVLSLNAQRVVVLSITVFFKWMKKRGHLQQNPAADIDLPRTEHRLPQMPLSIAEIERVLAQPDIEDPTGIRDRAIMEVLYSTGIRREEVAKLKVFDINAQKGTVLIRLGKGKRDRLLPIGARALAWVHKYLTEVRPGVVCDPDHGFLFVMKQKGTPIDPKFIGYAVKDALAKAGIKNKRGSTHLFRYSMATHLLEAGADVKFIQAMLGHRQVTTTDLYANMTLTKLKQVHGELHPTAKLRPTKKVAR